MARKLIVEIIGDASSLDAALGKASAAATGFGGRMKSAGAEMAAVGKTLTKYLTLPIVAIGAAQTKMAVDFQSSMELLHTQAGLPQKDVAALSAGVLKLATQVGVTPSTLSTGLFHVVSQGIKGTGEQLSVLKVAAQGSAMGMANMEDATNALGAILVNRIPGVHDVGQAMGEMNAIVGSGDMHFQDLADALGTALPSAASIAGVSLVQMGAGLAVLGDSNIRGAKAGTELASAIRLMAAPSTAAAKAFGKVGLSATQLADDIRSGGLVKALGDLRDHLAGLSKSQQMLDLVHMFGGKQATAVMTLLNQFDRLKTKVADIDAGGNKFASDWAAYTQTAAYKMNVLGASMSAAGISIGNILLPFVSKAVITLTDLANKFSALPGPVKDAILVMAGVVAVVGPVIGAIGSLATAIGFLAANPIVLAVTAIAALGAAIAFAVLAPQKLQSALESMGLSASTSGRIVHDLQTAFGYLKQAGQDLANYVRENWSTIQAIIQGTEQVVTGVVNVIVALWHEFGSNIITAAQNAWTLVKATIQNALKVIEGVVNVFAGVLHGNWSQLWEGVKEIVSGVFGEIEAILHYEVSQFLNLADAIGKALWAGIKAGGDLVLDFMKKLPGMILSALGDLGSLLIGAGKALMDGLLQGIESGAQGVLDKVKSLGGDITHAAKSIWKVFSPSQVFAEIGQNLMEGLQVGVDTGSKGAIASLKTTLRKAQDAINSDAGLVEEAARLLGVNATQAVVNGALGVQSTAASQLRTALVQAMTNAMAITQDAPEIKMAASQIGQKAAQAVVDGVVGKKVSVAQQIRMALTQAVQQAAQAVQQAQASATSSFNSLGQGILGQFDAANSKWLASAQKQLNAMQLQDQVKQYADAVTQAQQQLTQAQQQVQQTAQPSADQLQAISDATNKAQVAQDAYNNAVAKYGASSDQALSAITTLHNAQNTLAAAQAKTGTDYQAALQQQTSAQQAYDAAVRAQQEFQIGQTAAKQAAAHAKTLADQREALAKQLDNLRTELAKHPKQWDDMGKKVLTILKQYHVPLYQAGQKFASQFADGISSQIAAVEDAGKKLAEAVAKYIPRSPAKTGPLAFSSQAMGAKFGREFAQGISQGLYNGQGLASVADVFSTNTRIGGVGVGASSTLGAAGGPAVNVTVNVQGSLLGSTPEQIADSLKYQTRDALLTIGRSEPSIFKGLA